MKKFLSLVLALVMTMSLVTVSAGAADFTDDSKINYKEAVDVMTALGVVGGYSDGSFGPNGTLTRGAAAKIICNLILGTTTADALVADSAPYSDVPTDNVFAGYIAYLAKTGVVGGYADGTFRPAAPLTGYAFMKMLLGVIGLDADVEGYNEPNWSISVAKRALSEGVDLTDGLVGAFNGTKVVTREEACLYAFNAIKAGKFSYKDKSTLVVGDITISSTSEATQTKVVNMNKDSYYADVFSKLSYTSGKSDDYGRPAHVWKYDKKTVGTYADTAKLVYTTGVKGTDLADDLDDANIKVGKTVEIIRNGGDAETYTVGKTLKSSAKLGGNGIVLEIYTTENAAGDDVATLVVVISTYLAKVETIGKDKVSTKNTDERSLGLSYTDTRNNNITLTVKAEDDVADFDAVYSEVEKGDYVLIIPTGDNTASDEVLSIAIPETVTGKVTKVSTKNTVTVSGTTYDAAKTMNGTFVVDTVEQTIYLDTFGYAIGGEKVSTETEVVYLVKTFTETNRYEESTSYAQIVTADGEVQEIEVTPIDGDDELTKGVYTYELNDDDQAVFTSAVDSGDAVAVATGSKIKASDAKVSGKYYADDVTFVYINKSGSKLKVTTAEGVQKVDEVAADSFAVLNDDGEVVAVFIGAKAAAVVDKDALVFVANPASVGTAIDDENKKKNTYEFWMDGEKQVEIVDFKDGNDIGYYSYAVNSDNGHYELTAETDDVYTVKLTLDGGEIKQIHKNKYVNLNNKLQDRVLADDCTIFDTTDNDIETLSDIVYQVEEENAKLNLCAIYDSDAEEITCIYIYAR